MFFGRQDNKEPSFEKFKVIVYSTKMGALLLKAISHPNYREGRG